MEEEEEVRSSKAPSLAKIEFGNDENVTRAVRLDIGRRVNLLQFTYSDFVAPRVERRMRQAKHSAWMGLLPALPHLSIFC